MQWVLGVDALLRIEVKPALAALRLGPAVPGNAQGIETAAGQRQQVLLQGVDTKHVFDSVILQLSRRAIGAYPVGIAFAKKTAFNAIVKKTGILEIAQHGLLRSPLHGQIMV